MCLPFSNCPFGFSDLLLYERNENFLFSLPFIWMVRSRQGLRFVYQEPVICSLFSPERAVGLPVPCSETLGKCRRGGGVPLGWEKLLMFCLSSCSKEGPCPSSLLLMQFSGKDHALHTRVIPQEPHAYSEHAELSFLTIPVLLFPTCLC